MNKQFIALVAVLCCFAALLPAQTITASITGSANDPTGAIVVGATVTATNTETNVRSTSITNAEGLYNFPFLRLGN